MAFAYTIDYKILMPPAKKRETYSGQIWKIGGTFTNTGGGTGGEIPTSYDTIIDAFASNKTNANAIKVERNVSGAGDITLTCTADDDGSWTALVQNI